ncbi:MAG TPA: NAD(P)H-hydrate dehydratase [Gammaproteobacteria bacterium]|nr:NAD(P)H-hydrate dehydratase [Gammaproteobacteria bacterium]
MQEISRNLYRADQVRELDRIAIEQFGIPGFELMNRAGCVAFERLRLRWPDARRIAVLCGTGNNGGDGFVLARCVREAGMDVVVYQVGDAGRLSGDALQAKQLAEQLGITPEAWHRQALDAFDVLVDGLLGTGLRGEVSKQWAAAIEAINRSDVSVLALDIPSGLAADTGSPLGVAVRAQLTVTFIGRKQGLYTGEGPACCGEVLFESLDVPVQVYQTVPPAALLLVERQKLPPRSRSAHKGKFGHVLVVGGDYGMSGAARLAGEAALRAGAGLVSIATRRTHSALLNLSRPELMCHGTEQADELYPLLERATVVVTGPGLGQRRWGREMLKAVLGSQLPLVMDADALNLLATQPHMRNDWILTPHPGEAARLLQMSPADVQADRFGAVQALQNHFGGVCVLKGAGTLVYSQGVVPKVCSAGNPGMASGGMGDVLSGVIGSLLAQKIPLVEAAEQGVLIHALAADRAAVAGERGLLAHDLMPHLRKLVN